MMSFDESDFEPIEPEQIENKFVSGVKLDISNEEYHSSEGISNSGLLLLERSASDYIWTKEAPTFEKNSSADIGTALHTLLLEPELSESIIVAPQKTRTSDGFIEFTKSNPDCTVLTEREYQQLDFMHKSAMSHPVIKKLLTELKSEREQSIYKEIEGVLCKIRPDIDFIPTGLSFLGDVKTTEDIAEWRSELHWKKPLYKYNYGHQAAFYLIVARAFYQKEINEFVFIVISKTLEMGKYPVGVFKITWNRLVELGFVDRVMSNIAKFKNRTQTGNWFEIEELENEQ